MSKNNLMKGVLLLICGDFHETLTLISKSTPVGKIHTPLKHCGDMYKHIVLLPYKILKQNI